MKRVVLLVVAFCMLFLVACSGKGQAESGKNEAEPEILDHVEEPNGVEDIDENLPEENETNEDEPALIAEETIYTDESHENVILLSKYDDGAIISTISFDGKDIPAEVFYMQTVIVQMMTRNMDGLVNVMTSGEMALYRVENGEWSCGTPIKQYEDVDGEARDGDVYNEIISAFDRIEEA